MQVTLQNYQRLALRTCTEKNRTLMHSILGISTEVGELFEGAEAKTNANYIEECGDVLWYVALGCFVVGIDIADLVLTNTDGELEMFAVMQGHAADVAKRHFFYNTELDRDRLIGVFTVLVSLIRDTNDLALEDIMHINIAKLQLRYPEKYSDEQAVTRDVAKEEAMLVREASDILNKRQ